MTPRAMNASDRRFVAPTWALSSSYDGLSKASRFKLVDRMLDGGAPVIVLAEGATVHAWACGEAGVLHYAYCPPELRRHGIVRRLITSLFGEYPEHIATTHEWPWESRRFVFRPHLMHREAAA